MRTIIARLFLLVLILSFYKVNAQPESVFRIPATMNSTLSVIPLNEHFERDSTLCVLDSSACLYGLSVDMQIIRKSPDFLVRLVFEDNNGHNYLVAESYSELSNVDTLTLAGFCEETSFLLGVFPKQLKLYIKDADVLISSFNVSFHTPLFGNIDMQNYSDSIRKLQIKDKVNRINANNEQFGRLWHAEVTSLSLLPYETKMRIMNCSDSDSSWGLEYYAGGIFQFGNYTNSPSAVQSKSSNPPEIFDWRDAYGKNYITSIKDQMNSNGCVAFATIGALEAITNVYFNQQIDIDLSEQEIISCSNPLVNVFLRGTTVESALEYAQDKGLVTETDYPFVNHSDTVCTRCQITPSEVIAISGYSSYYLDSGMDILKEKLCTNGPLIGTIFSKRTNGKGHAMVIVGYGKIYAGMQCYEWYPNNSTTVKRIVVPDDSPYIGQTFLILKNSWGTDSTIGEDGYVYSIIDDEDVELKYYSIETPISSMHYGENERISEDKDGDGCYFWPIGPQPNTCPDWVIDGKDMDDNNPYIGRLLPNGNIENLNPNERDTLYIHFPNSTNHYQYCYDHIVINNGGGMIVDQPLYCFNNSRIIVKSGGKLTITASGYLNDAILELEPGSEILLIGGGKIRIKQGYNFVVTRGAKLTIENGIVE